MAIDRSLFKVTVGGVDISAALGPVLDRIAVRDATGASSDTAEIGIDDREGRVVFPRAGASIEISLTDPRGQGLVFRGVVDKPTSRGGRSGGTQLTISAKGMNTLSSVKQLRERHWDGGTIGEALDQAARAEGLKGARVDPAFAGQQRAYIAQQGESFVAFGQRLARELGGTFKVAGDQAVLLRRGGGASVSGRSLPTIEARRGVNLIEWSISPLVGRRRYGAASARVYDPATGEFVTHTAAAGRAGPTHVARFATGDDSDGAARAGADAREADREAGSGEVRIDGDARARPEAICRIIGARPGIDGDYRITAVEHTLDRGGGFETRLELGEPQGAAGTDERGGA